MFKELKIDDVLLLKVMSNWNKVDTRLLMSSVKFKRTKFYNCLHKLMDLGLIERVLTGEYQLTDKGRQLAERLMDPLEALKALKEEGKPLKVKVSESEVVVRNLEGLLSVIDKADVEGLYKHLKSGSLVEWLYALGDKYLSKELSKVKGAISRWEVRDKLKEIIEGRVCFLKELASLAAEPKRGRRAS
ncbi:MAG: hypothetical protein QFX33_01680 [Candidatus Nezhaarchaeota archaeon]|nr:hypothetical protein [Candidatus Nezhaarchaeota archaeon]